MIYGVISGISSEECVLCGLITGVLFEECELEYDLSGFDLQRVFCVE